MDCRYSGARFLLLLSFFFSTNNAARNRTSREKAKQKFGSLIRGNTLLTCSELSSETSADQKVSSSSAVVVGQCKQKGIECSRRQQRYIYKDSELGRIVTLLTWHQFLRRSGGPTTDSANRRDGTSGRRRLQQQQRIVLIRVLIERARAGQVEFQAVDGRESDDDPRSTGGNFAEIGSRLCSLGDSGWRGGDGRGGGGGGGGRSSWGGGRCTADSRNEAKVF